MNQFCKIFSVIVITICFLTPTKTLSWEIGGRVAKFDRFNGMCRGNKDTKIFFNYYGIRTENNRLYMNATITVTEDINSPPTLAMIIKRCKSKENPDTCENFHSFKTDKYCDLISSDSELWNPFFSSIRPKWKCPIKKGFYKTVNSSFDIGAILLFPLDGWYWKVLGELYDGVSGKKIMCCLVEARVFPRKNAS